VIENKQIKKTDAEATQQEIIKIRQELKKSAAEAVDKMRQEMITTVKNEVNSLGQTMPTKGTNTQKTEKKKSYSDAMAKKRNQ